MCSLCVAYGSCGIRLRQIPQWLPEVSNCKMSFSIPHQLKLQSHLSGDKELKPVQVISATLQWPHNGRDGVSNHQPHFYLPKRLFRCRSKKTSKLRVTGLCAGNSPVTGEFPAQMASNAENVSIWWRHHEANASPSDGQATALSENTKRHQNVS